MNQEIAQAQQYLAFILDDRAPHGFVMLCKRWHLKTLAVHFSQDQVLRPLDSTWQQVRGKEVKELEPLGCTVGRGLPDTYGVSKPIKATLRYITGVRREIPKERETQQPKGGKEQNLECIRAPTDQVEKEMVRLLRVVCTTLKEIDI